VVFYSLTAGAPRLFNIPSATFQARSCRDLADLVSTSHASQQKGSRVFHISQYNTAGWEVLIAPIPGCAKRSSRGRLKTDREVFAVAQTLGTGFESWCTALQEAAP
jgi:hypothetical protein